MPHWDDRRDDRRGAQNGPRQHEDRDRWRSDPRDSRGGSEQRSFGGDDGQARRYAARFDQDRTGYGRRDEADERDWRGPQQDSRRFGAPQVSERYGVEPYAYGGQEYGMERHDDPRERGGGWGFDRGSPERERHFDRQDPGVGQGPAGYAPQAQPHPDHDLEPDYLRWRDEQMRGHDEDYREWRRQQHAQYDHEYRQFRGERQRHFGQAFHQWRSQRSAVGGAPDTSVAPGVSGYGDKTAVPGGYNAPSAYDKPTGVLDPPGHLSTDPAMSQTGGSGGQAGGASASGGSGLARGGSEFGKEPPQVQASADGGVRRDADKGSERANDDSSRTEDKGQRH